MPGILSEFRGWLKDILLAVVIAFLMVVFLYQPVKVEGTSMQPELLDQERIFVNKFLYHFEEIHRGDIVVFWYPKDPSKSFIKRVVGVPGDLVAIRDGQVYINGELLKNATCRGAIRTLTRTRRRGSRRALLRAGRSSQRQQRQPFLGTRASPVHLRQRPSFDTGQLKRRDSWNRDGLLRVS